MWRWRIGGETRFAGERDRYWSAIVAFGQVAIAVERFRDPAKGDAWLIQNIGPVLKHETTIVQREIKRVGHRTGNLLELRVVSESASRTNRIVRPPLSKHMFRRGNLQR